MFKSSNTRVQSLRNGTLYEDVHRNLVNVGVLGCPRLQGSRFWGPFKNMIGLCATGPQYGQ
eukprot:10838464-Prorocentrum_lima.AAC.1